MEFSHHINGHNSAFSNGRYFSIIQGRELKIIEV